MERIEIICMMVGNTMERLVKVNGKGRGFGEGKWHMGEVEVNGGSGRRLVWRGFGEKDD